jgi:hypothetical protein
MNTVCVTPTECTPTREEMQLLSALSCRGRKRPSSALLLPLESADDIPITSMDDEDSFFLVVPGNRKNKQLRPSNSKFSLKKRSAEIPLTLTELTAPRLPELVGNQEVPRPRLGRGRKFNLSMRPSKLMLSNVGSLYIPPTTAEDVVSSDTLSLCDNIENLYLPDCP